MRYMIVDDEALALKHLEKTLLKVDPDAEIVKAVNYEDALLHQGEDFRAVFLDIDMPGMNGLQLAKALQEEKENLNIIFVTAFDEYALDAYKIYASGYVPKPCNADDIQKQLLHLRYQNAPLPKLRVRCFGQFEVFCGNEPLVFERTTAKEILAYLVHVRGASATREEICTALWENSEDVERRKGYFRSLMMSLRSTLEKYNAGNMLISRRNSYAINIEEIDCDYYRYLKGDSSPRIQYRGEYMMQYSWAEDANERLMEFSAIS